MSPKNSIEFKLWGRYALFTDPLTKIGGEKCSYHIPTYEALKGVVKSIYWKPTIIWYIDKVRVLKKIRTQTKGIKPLKMSGGNDLSIYSFLSHVEYQVMAHFEWNNNRPELKKDQNDGKHYNIATRMLERGGRQDIFLGTRDCQGYVEPCVFGSGEGEYDSDPEIAYSLMFHGFDYPDETGKNEFWARFCKPVMKNGVIEFLKPDDFLKNPPPMGTARKFIREMTPKQFEAARNLFECEKEEALL